MGVSHNEFNTKACTFLQETQAFVKITIFKVERVVVKNKPKTEK